MTRDEPTPIVVFVHIPKTAGTTLRRIVSREYGGTRHVHRIPNFFNKLLVPAAMGTGISEDALERMKRFAKEPPGRQERRRGASAGAQIRAAQGHAVLQRNIAWPKDTQFFTILRDPVRRAISHYHQLPGKTVTLEEAISQGQIPDNSQTRVLTACTAPLGEIPDGTLERAIESLDRFSVVGLTERFDESLVLLTRTFGWARSAYRSRNVTKSRQEIPPETIELIERHNVLDAELYRHACERFERDVRSQGDDFAIEVAALQRANARLSALPEDDVALDPLPPSILNGSSPASFDLRELLIEAQANLLVREEIRLEFQDSRAARLQSELTSSANRVKELEATVARLQRDSERTPARRAKKERAEDGTRRARKQGREGRQDKEARRKRKAAARASRQTEG
jgi:hypothetical protein